jgi:hypothetical protein
VSAPTSKVTQAVRGVVSRLQEAVGGGPTSLDGEARSRWRSVTINRSPQEVMPGGTLPGPLAALGDAVEVEVRPAPGGKGTELAARLRAAGPTGPRSALRQAKQLIEVGEVLRVDPQPHGHRPATPTGKLVESATRHAGGEGVL